MPTPRNATVGPRLYGICFTFNNYSEEDVLRIKGCLGQRGISYICFGREVGKQGTPHLQGYLQSTIKNFARLQKAVGPCAMAQANAESGPNESEVNNTFGKPYTAIGYCMKDGDFFETGIRQHIEAAKVGQRNDLREAMQAVKQNATDLTLMEEHSSVMARYSKFVGEYRKALELEGGKQYHKEQLSNIELYPWQQHIITQITDAATERTIYWVWSDAGNMGKSVFSKYLGLFHDALVLDSGKKNDIHYIFSKNQKKVVTIDLARSTKVEHMEHFYSIAETLKNGVMTVGKYDGGVIWFIPPHIIFFANMAPDHSKWSEDRLVELKLD